MDGFLLINKPKGITSFDVIRKLRKILQTRKIGHAGTLDPMAAGLLIIAIGQGTKLLEYLIKQDKTYLAEITFGSTSDTYDAEGKIQKTGFVGEISQKQIEVILKKFTGQIKQIPPQYSALKINGQKACDLARKGEEVKLKSRDITIYSIKIINFKSPLLNLEVSCSSGTYIRSLAHDIGQKLKCGGLLSKLQRTKIGTHDISQSITLDKVKTSNILPLEWGIKDLPIINISEQEKQSLLFGQLIPTSEKFKNEKIIACLHHNKLISLCKYNDMTKKLCPVKNFNNKN